MCIFNTDSPGLGSQSIQTWTGGLLTLHCRKLLSPTRRCWQTRPTTTSIYRSWSAQNSTLVGQATDSCSRWILTSSPRETTWHPSTLVQSTSPVAQRKIVSPFLHSLLSNYSALSSWINLLTLPPLFALSMFATSMVDERGPNRFSTSPARGGQASWPHPKDLGDGNGGWILSSQCHIESVNLYNLHGKSKPTSMGFILSVISACFFSSMEHLATSSNLSKVGLLIQSFSLLSTTYMNMLLPSSAITNLKKKFNWHFSLLVLCHKNAT